MESIVNGEQYGLGANFHDNKHNLLYFLVFRLQLLTKWCIRPLKAYLPVREKLSLKRNLNTTEGAGLLPRSLKSDGYSPFRSGRTFSTSCRRTA